MIYEVGIIGQEAVFRVDAVAVDIENDNSLVLHGESNVKMHVSGGNWKYYLVLSKAQLDLMSEEGKTYII